MSTARSRHQSTLNAERPPWTTSASSMLATSASSSSHTRGSLARLEALLGDERCARFAHARDEVDFALLAGLEHAEGDVLVGRVDEPVAREERWRQPGHVSSVLETKRTDDRAALAERRSGVE